MKLSIANIFIIINEINLLYNWRKCMENYDVRFYSRNFI